MPTKVQSVPKGLLAALGATGTGRNPDMLLESVSVVLDGRSFYFGRPEVLVASSGAVSAIFAGASIAVPQNEVWRVLGLGVQGTMSLANGLFNCHIGVQSIAGQFTMPLVSTDTTRIASVNGEVFALGTETDILLPSGSQIRGQLGCTVTTGTCTLVVETLIQRIVNA